MAVRSILIGPFGQLLAVGAISELLYLSWARTEAVNGWPSVLGFLAKLLLLFLLFAVGARVILSLRAPSRPILWLVAVAALGFRLTLIPAGLPPEASLADDLAGQKVAFDRFQLYDNDIWRYLWDGHSVAHRQDPYTTPVNSPQADGLAPEGSPWADIRENVTYPQTPTIYPPLAQAVFAMAHAIAPASVAVMKSLTVCFDLITILLLAWILRVTGQDPALCLLYAWNPLIVKFFAGSGHIDSLMNALVAATLLLLVKNLRTAASLTFGLAILAKLSPLILVPLLLRRLGFRRILLSAAVVFLGYLPFASSGLHVFDGFNTFSRFWVFNAGPFHYFNAILGPDLARACCAACLLLVVLIWWRKDQGTHHDLLTASADLLGALSVLSPAVMPWYLSWAQPAAVVSRRWFWISMSALTSFAFLVMVDGAEREWARALEYGIAAAFALFLFVKHSIQRWNQNELQDTFHAGLGPVPSPVASSR